MPLGEPEHWLRELSARSSRPCPTYGGGCYDPEHCMQGGDCASAKKYAEPAQPEAEPTTPPMPEDKRCPPPSDCWLAWEWQVHRQVEAVAKLARQKIAEQNAKIQRLWSEDAMRQRYPLRTVQADTDQIRDLTAQRDEAEAALDELLDLVDDESTTWPGDPAGVWQRARQVRDRARERGESTRD